MAAYDLTDLYYELDDIFFNFCEDISVGNYVGHYQIWSEDDMITVKLDLTNASNGWTLMSVNFNFHDNSLVPTLNSFLQVVYDWAHL